MNPSDLERYLQEQSAGGAHQSEGTFTLARDEALRKIAAFQLPFANAWLVKLVQCAVATESGSPITITLRAQSLSQDFALSAVSLEEFEAAFFNPEPASHPAIQNLLAALWTVGLKEKWPFQLSLSGWKESLIWDGERLTRLPLPQPSDQARVTIVFVQREAGVLQWAKWIASSRSRNIELLATLKTRCFTCPVPLTVDGRRLDSLYHCPTHGPTSRDHVITLGFAQHSGLVPLPLPPGTFELKAKARKTQKFWTMSLSEPIDSGGLFQVSKKVLARTERVELCPAPFLLTAHRTMANKPGGMTVWTDGAALSVVYWVRHGVVVDEDVLDILANPTSVAIFLSAEGLATDLTSFQLSQCHSKARRLEFARREVAAALNELTTLKETLEQTVRKGTLRGRILAGGLFTLGATVLWTLPWAGVSFMAAGGGMLHQSGKSQERLNEEVLASIKALQDLVLNR